MPQVTVTTGYYEFLQNNSGGHRELEPTKGIGMTVLIEAMNDKHANARAEAIGIYFDGVRAGRDCDCCGNRWYRADGKWEYDDWKIHSPMYHARPSYVHHLDGSITVVA
jgi:hypothetical protein